MRKRYLAGRNKNWCTHRSSLGLYCLLDDGHEGRHVYFEWQIEKEPDVEDPLGKLKDAFKDYRASHDEIDELIRSVRERNFDDDEKEPDAE